MQYTRIERSLVNSCKAIWVDELEEKIVYLAQARKIKRTVSSSDSIFLWNCIENILIEITNYFPILKNSRNLYFIKAFSHLALK
jgi:hypothetical protein